MGLDDAFDDCQPNPCSFGGGIELIEQAEDLVMKYRVNSDAVVLHEQDRESVAICSARADLDHGIPLIAHEFDRVVHQVLDGLDDAFTISPDHWQAVRDFDVDTPLTNLPGHAFDRLRSEERRVGKECRSRW